MTPPTRHFFKHGGVVRRVPKLKRPKHRGKTVSLRLENGSGRLMTTRSLAQLQGRIKGGQTAHARGTARQWTSEEATAAIKKAWATRWKVQTRIGIRVGKRLIRRPPVHKKAVRSQHCEHATRGVQWHPDTGVWTVTDALGHRIIGEMAALRRLGYLPKANGTYAGIEYAVETGHYDRNNPTPKENV